LPTPAEVSALRAAALLVVWRHGVGGQHDAMEEMIDFKPPKYSIGALTPSPDLFIYLFPIANLQI